MENNEEQSTDCPYCHHLKPNIDKESAHMPYEEFIRGISRKSCRYCTIILATIRAVKPQLLTKKGRFGARPGTNVHLSINDTRVVRVSVEKHGMFSSEGSFQVYLTDGMQRSIELGKPLRDIATVAGELPMWEFLRSCLRDCVNQHPACARSQQDKWFPKRLLVLEKCKTGSGQARLIHTEQEAPQSHYLALSHCWGGKSHFCATKANIDALEKHVDLSKLPRTFRDCITVAQELDIRYVWIDSLCIVQDDKADWSLQSQDMDRVYQNAFLTVAAVTSPNSSVPFLGKQAPSSRKKCQAINISVGSPLITVKARDHDAINWGSLDHDPLHTRAWAFQEALFSHRTISFLVQKVQWACKTTMCCESGEGYEVPLVLERLADEPPPLVLKDWPTVVADYSQRDLTYWTDRLPALSGVASHFQRHSHSDYLAGLWADDFPRCLAWRRRELHDCPDMKRKIRGSPDNVVPSWSWASVFGRVDGAYFCDLLTDADTENIGPYANETELESRVELLSTYCQPSTENLFGEVKRGSYLALRGKVVDAEMVCDIYGCGLVRRKGLKPQLAIPDCRLSVRHQHGTRLNSMFTRKKNSPWLERAVHNTRFDMTKCGGRSSGRVLCLLLFTAKRNGKTPACALILSPHPDIKGTYQRLGIGLGDFGLGSPLYYVRRDWKEWKDWEDLGEWDNWEEWFADAETRTLRLA